jgi:tRNA A37 methylthiotransferase MiaB
MTNIADSQFYKEELTKRLEAASNGLVNALTQSVQSVITTCVVCDHWNQVNEVCTLYNNQRPPAKVIAFGCPAFVNEIPF